MWIDSSATALILAVLQSEKFSEGPLNVWLLISCSIIDWRSLSASTAQEATPKDSSTSLHPNYSSSFTVPKNSSPGSRSGASITSPETSTRASSFSK